MTLQELRVILQEWFCGCGHPEVAAERLRDLLALHPLYEHRAELNALIPDEGIQYLVLYMLDRLELSEHGSSVGGAWLTDKGRAVLDAMNRESAAGFGVIVESVCIHGYSIENDQEHCPECQSSMTDDAPPLVQLAQHALADSVVSDERAGRPHMSGSSGGDGDRAMAERFAFFRVPTWSTLPRPTDLRPVNGTEEEGGVADRDRPRL